MPVFSTITIDFLDAFEPDTATPLIFINAFDAIQNAGLSVVVEKIVATRTQSGEFSTGTDDITQAGLYKDALDLDLDPLEYEVSIIGNVVTIGSLREEISFSDLVIGQPNTSRATFVINNDAINIPRTEGIIPARSNYYVTRPIVDPNVVSQTVNMWFNSDLIDPDYQQRTPDYQSTQLRPSANWENFDLAITQYARDFITPKLPTFTPGIVDSVAGSVITSSISVRNNLEAIDQPILNQAVTTLGYATYQQGATPKYSQLILLSSQRHQVKRGELIIVPVNTNAVTTSIVFTNPAGDLLGLDTLIPSGDVTKQIQYVCFSTAGLTDDFVEVNGTHIFELIDECLYKTQPVRFLNRFGVWENLTFFKAEKESLQVTREGNFKNNYVNGGTYDTTRHLYRNTDTNARRSLQLTTGYISEQQNAAIDDLLLSDYVYLENGEPIEVDTNSVDKKTRIVDKLINYEIAFKYSSDLVQVV